MRGAAFILVAVCLAAGCGGLRKGYFSMPYVGEPTRRSATASTRHHQSRMQEILLPDLKMHVDLVNSFQVSDTIWFGVGFPMVPVRIKRSQPPTAGTNCAVHIHFKSLESGIEFDPSRATLWVDGESHLPGRFKRFLSSTRQWSEVSAGPMAFTNGGWYWFSLEYEIPRPKPDRDIRLELEKAIRHPNLDPFPVIRFKKMKWSEWYG